MSSIFIKQVGYRLFVNSGLMGFDEARSTAEPIEYGRFPQSRRFIR